MTDIDGRRRYTEVAKHSLPRIARKNSYRICATSRQSIASIFDWIYTGSTGNNRLGGKYNTMTEVAALVRLE